MKGDGTQLSLKNNRFSPVHQHAMFDVVMECPEVRNARDKPVAIQAG